MKEFLLSVGFRVCPSNEQDYTLFLHKTDDCPEERNRLVYVLSTGATYIECYSNDVPRECIYLGHTSKPENLMLLITAIRELSK